MEIEMEKRKMNIVYLNKWALIKEKREEMERVCNNIRIVKQRKNVLTKAICSFHIINKMYKIFNKRRTAVLLYKRINLSVYKLGLKTQTIPQKEGTFERKKGLFKA
jgi:hypothetical protein